MKATLTSLFALVCTTTIAVTAIAQGVAVDAPGTTIRVGPDRGAGGGVQVQAPAGIKVHAGGDQAKPAGPQFGNAIPAPPVEKKFRIGIVGGDVSPALRKHLGLDGVGVSVMRVVPDSPASKAGVEEHDILLSADGSPLASIGDLVDAVRTAGPDERPIKLELIQRGKTLTLEVLPELSEVQPNPVTVPVDGFADLFGGGNPPGFGGRQPFQFRMFGPGVVVGGGGMGSATVQANGIAVQTQTVNGETRVTAKKGDQTWEFNAADKAALDKLPPDVRQMVDSVTTMGGGGVGVNVDADQIIKEMAPALQGLFNRQGEPRGLRQRLEELRRRQQGAAPEAFNDAPANAGGDAPVFEPGDAIPAEEPVEIEIPAEAK